MLLFPALLSVLLQHHLLLQLFFFMFGLFFLAFVQPLLSLLLFDSLQIFYLVVLSNQLLEVALFLPVVLPCCLLELSQFLALFSEGLPDCFDRLVSPSLSLFHLEVVVCEQKLAHLTLILLALSNLVEFVLTAMEGVMEGLSVVFPPEEGLLHHFFFFSR